MDITIKNTLHNHSQRLPPLQPPWKPMSQRHHRRQGRDAGVDHGADQPNGHLEHGDLMGLNGDLNELHPQPVIIPFTTSYN